ncbi:MAG TPA: alpha/beta fold hydrolase [Candidatus Dormibacteraeota bacterium]|nr:alpha/beta fold hydrolase [Candidatus Dormibacteraeota bacterium]
MRARCDDIDVAWFEAGRGDPLVLVHGLADDHRAWRRTVPDLMLRHRLVMYDLRGHGETSLGRPDGTLRQLGDDLANLLDALRLERVDVAGFSLGGTIAMRIALDHPHLVRRLVLVATSSRVGRAACEWYRERASMVERSDPRLRDTLDTDTADVYAQSPGELEEGLLIRRQSTADPRGYGNACAAMAGLNAAPLDPELPRIQAPTLIVASDRDQHCPPRAAEIIAAGVAGSRLEIIEGAGHPIPVERPRELARSINSFLAEVG